MTKSLRVYCVFKKRPCEQGRLLGFLHEIFKTEKQAQEYCKKRNDKECKNDMFYYLGWGVEQ